jgi:peptidoglycan hydrolase-like protein with peptidoglycan-binding domain
MTGRRLQTVLAVFGVLAGVVLFNVLYLQGAGRARGPRVDASSPQPTKTTGTAPVATPPQTEVPIRAIQVELESRGYGVGRPDGVLSLVTRAAILAYEVDHGLPLTADASEDLLKAMVLGSADDTIAATQSRAPVGPHAEQLIKTVQRSLTELGFGPIKIDGHLGEATNTAISRFERDQGVPPTGRISAAMVAKLARAAAQTPAARQSR